MNTLLTHTALLAGLSMLLAPTVLAQESAPWLLAKYDLNGDAQITQAEVAEKKQRLFLRMDEDNDGDVSFAEYQLTDQARRAALLKARFNKLDEDHNGRVSEQEYASFLGMFNSFDSNGDGSLTGQEVDLSSEQSAQITRCLLWFCLRTDLQ
ncbi:MAG: EF-hand domain-containing protein [Cellvibrionaceae bacterium]